MAQPKYYNEWVTYLMNSGLSATAAAQGAMQYGSVHPSSAPDFNPAWLPGSSTSGGTGSGGGGASAGDSQTENYIQQVKLEFPWIEVLGLWKMVENAIRNDEPWELIYARLQQTDQYKRQFAGMFDNRGQRRFASEAEYLNELEKYRQVLRTYGAYDPKNDDPLDFVSMITQGITPEQLEQRFRVYKELERSGQDVVDAFYVYAGMNITVDDLYRATVSDEYREKLRSSYNQTVAGQKLDYEKFITRATERGLNRVVSALGRMQKLGMLTGQAVAEIQAIDPNFAREMMGALFTAGGDKAAKSLSLDELMASFEYALIGSAATESGLAMPTKERIEELRRAGIDRAQALRAYGSFAEKQNALDAMAQRAKLTDSFDQQMFEDAVLLARGDAQRVLQRAMSFERSLGQQQGAFQQRLSDDGRLEQVGRAV